MFDERKCARYMPNCSAMMLAWNVQLIGRSSTESSHSMKFFRSQFSCSNCCSLVEILQWILHRIDVDLTRMINNNSDDLLDSLLMTTKTTIIIFCCTYLYCAGEVNEVYARYCVWQAWNDMKMWISTNHNFEVEYQLVQVFRSTQVVSLRGRSPNKLVCYVSITTVVVQLHVE